MTIYEPAVTPETEKHWETRRTFRDDLLHSLGDRLTTAGETVESGPLEGVHIVTRAQWMDVIYEIGNVPLPPIDDHVAEVVTGATVLVWARCPRCHIAGAISLTIEPELRVDDASAELRLRAKAKPRTHVCGQLTIPAMVPAEGQESLNLDDLTGPHCGKAIPVEGSEVADSCFLPEGHEGDCERASSAEIIEEPALDPGLGDPETDCPWPGCERYGGHTGAHQTAADDRPDEDGAP